MFFLLVVIVIVLYNPYHLVSLLSEKATAETFSKLILHVIGTIPVPPNVIYPSV